MDVTSMIAEQKRCLREANAFYVKAQSENRAITDDEFKQVRALKQQADDLTLQIADENERVETQAQLKAIEAWQKQPQKKATVILPSSGRTFDSVFGRVATTPNLYGGGVYSSGRFNGLGDFLQAVGNAPMHHDERLQLAATAFGGMSEGIDSAGGFAVPVEYARRIITGFLEGSWMMKNCDVRPMASQTLRVPAFDDSDRSGGLLYGGIKATWAAEAAQPDTSTAKLRQLELAARKLFILVPITSEALADGINMESELGNALSESASFFLEECMIASGTGAGQPLSVLNSEGVIEVSPEAGQGEDTITYANLAAMVGKLHPACFANSSWLVNPTCVPQLLKLTIPVENAAGEVVGGSFYPALTESNGQYRLLGRPCVLTEKAKALGEAGDLILLDPSQYIIGLRQQISIDRSAHVGFLNDTVYFRMIVRVDGMSKWQKTVTLKNGGTVGWAVTLGAREGSGS